MIVPSRFHAPPRPPGASARICTAPRSTSIRFIFPSAKNPTDWLSGDQKGSEAPSVPAKARPETESSGRTHNLDCPSEVATNTIFCPSGEIAIDAGSAVGGVEISRRTSATGGEPRNSRVPLATARTVATTKAVIHTRSRRRGTTGGATAAACGWGFSVLNLAFAVFLRPGLPALWTQTRNQRRLFFGGSARN